MPSGWRDAARFERRHGSGIVRGSRNGAPQSAQARLAKPIDQVKSSGILPVTSPNVSFV